MNKKVISVVLCFLICIASISYSNEINNIQTSVNGIETCLAYYGEISPKTGRPKTVHVREYQRKDGTKVKSHYRSRPKE